MTDNDTALRASSSKCAHEVVTHELDQTKREASHFLSSTLNQLLVVTCSFLVPSCPTGTKVCTPYYIASTCSCTAETASLLRDPDREQNGHLPDSEPSFAHRLAATLQEPLTPLTKVLLVLTLLFLLLSSVFIGLFAGAQHNLNAERGNHGGGEKPLPSTVTVTTTSVSSTATTATSVAYSTAFSTVVTTAVSTITETATVSVVLPIPTGTPDEVRCKYVIVHGRFTHIWLAYMS